MEGLNIRKLLIQSIFVLVAVVLLARLLHMQVLTTTYGAEAEDISVREEVEYPSRGLIFDRNGELVVNNEPVYDLMIVPRQAKSFDTLKLCRLLHITPGEFGQQTDDIKTSGLYAYKPQALFKQLPIEVYAGLQEYLYQFPGIYKQVRTVRHYPHHSAAHTLGYIGEVNQRQIDTSEYYKLRDYIGISGIEKTYEPLLRGKKGVSYSLVNVHGTEIAPYKDGNMDVKAVAGSNLQLTIDMQLQAYAEKLMQNKKGSVVAIEPHSGEILALVSSPAYDPNLLTGRQRGMGMAMLSNDTLRPLYNRALMAEYPPGSTFKPLMALLALQDGVITPNYYYGCYGGYYLGPSHTVGCHGHSPCYNVPSAIQHSCNAYFCQLFKLFINNEANKDEAAGLSKWDHYLNEFGLGVQLPTDLPNLKKGNVPSPAFYDKLYKNRGGWRANTIISLSIGQGEMGVTPLQMANFTAIIANKGYYVAPHVIRPPANDMDSPFRQRHYVSIDQRHFEPVVKGLEQVVLWGTGRSAFIPGISLCGKTGTAQNPHGDDHSIFIAFAPKDNPKIAIAVVVENGGYGSTYAAPIASLVAEYYLKNGAIHESRKWLETKMFDTNLIHKNPIVVASQTN